jgi:hypothetical protein
MYWPTPEKPSLKGTFNTLRQMGGYGKKIPLFSDVIVHNVLGKPIPHARPSPSTCSIRTRYGLATVSWCSTTWRRWRIATPRAFPT